MYNAEQIKREAWVKGYKAGRSLTNEWQALEKIKREAFEQGRAAGFAAGYAAAQGQPQEKIEQAYEQGIKDAALLRPIRRGGGY